MVEPIASNTFDKYFAPLTFRNVTVSWEEPGHLKVDIQAAGRYGFYYSSEQVGMGVEAPLTLLEATYAFRFRMNPQARIKETKHADLFWYGAGYSYAEYWGCVSWPLFRAYLDASTNHVYLVFDGKIQVSWGTGGVRNIWPFGEWIVDLGDESEFKDWKWIIIHIDPQDRCFRKIMVGEREIPPPPGYDRFKPDLEGGNVGKGIFVGKLTGEESTNAQFLIDDVYVYPTYWTPSAEKPPEEAAPPTGGAGFPSWLLWLLLLLGGGALTAAALKRRRKKTA
jgi:hypothetical protein